MSTMHGILNHSTEAGTRHMHQRQGPGICTRGRDQAYAPEAGTRHMHQRQGPSICTIPSLGRTMLILNRTYPCSPHPPNTRAH
eukprot:1144641-Pelagomonas_calceolata.AAC.3